MRAALLAPCLLALACRPVVEPQQFCAVDDECARDEVCVNNSCARAEGCTPDNLDNAEAPFASADSVDLIEGHACPGEAEFFSVASSVGDPLVVYVDWEPGLGVNFDLILHSGQTQTVLLESTSGARELGGVVVAVPPPQQLELRPANLPAAGVDFRVTFKTGPSCLLDDQCGGQSCVYPLHTPVAPNGNPPPNEQIFVPGVCGAPRAPECAAPDALEGPTATASDAIAVPAAATGCASDEDWFTVPVAETADLVLSLQNNGQLAGDYVIQVYDGAGNLVSAQAFLGIPAGVRRQMSSPFLAAADVLARVTQLHDEESTYALTAELTPAACAIDNDCAVTGIQEYGRTSCDLGACVCPAPRCAP